MTLTRAGRRGRHPLDIAGTAHYRSVSTALIRGSRLQDGQAGAPLTRAYVSFTAVPLALTISIPLCTPSTS